MRRVLSMRVRAWAICRREPALIATWAYRFLINDPSCDTDKPSTMKVDSMAKATMLLLLFVAMDGSLLGQSYFRDVARLGGTYAEDSASGDSACGTIEVAPGPLGGASMF